MNEPIIDPSLGLRLIAVLSWALIILGLGKMVIYAIGEFAPRAYERIRSEKARKFMTGKGNRLLFGLGGFLTALFGFICLLLGRLFEHLHNSL